VFSLLYVTVYRPTGEMAYLEEILSLRISVFIIDYLCNTSEDLTQEIM